MTGYCKDCGNQACECDVSNYSAFDTQEGGNHYKKYGIQPSYFFQENKINWYEANVCKYVIRHKDKNGFEDLKKAMHYLEMIAEHTYGESLDKE